MSQIWYHTENVHSSPMTTKIILFSAIFLLAAQPKPNNAQIHYQNNVFRGRSGDIFRQRQRDFYYSSNYGRTEYVDEIRPNAGRNAVVMLTWRRFNIPDDMPACSHTSISVYIG